MLNKWKVVAFTGKAGAGKDTAADRAWDWMYGRSDYKPLQSNFANALKHVCLVKFDLTSWQVETQEGKAEFLPEWGCTVREILQREGQTTREVWGEDHWVKLWESRIEGADVIVTDCRYDNEAEAVKRRGGFIIEIVRPDKKVLTETEAQHSSEQGIDRKYIDATIVNDGTIDQLYEQVNKVLDGLYK